MILWIKAKFPHFIFLGVLIVYLFSANSLYNTFILKNGKPVPLKVQIPPEKNDFEFYFLPVSEVRYDGQDLYALQGYALHDSLPTNEYTIKVIFHSTTENLVFDVDTAAVPNVIKMRKDYNPKMNRAEFRMLFAKNVLKIDNYQIGILLLDKQGTPN